MYGTIKFSFLQKITKFFFVLPLFVVIFLASLFLAPPAQAVQCIGQISCCTSGDWEVDYGPAGCSTTPCPLGESDCVRCTVTGSHCKTTPNNVSCDFQTAGSSCSGCSENYVSGSCYPYIPAPPPPPPSCGGGPACSAGENCCADGSCSPNCDPPPPPPCNKPAADWVCCPNGEAAANQSECGSSGSVCLTDYSNNIGTMWVRAISREPNGSIVYWKGSQAVDPVKSGDDHVWSVSPIDQSGFFDQYKISNSSAVRTFDRNINRISPEMDVQMFVRSNPDQLIELEESGKVVDNSTLYTWTKDAYGNISWTVNTEGCKPKEVKLTTSTFPAGSDEYWSNQYCGGGQPENLTADGAPGPNSDDNRMFCVKSEIGCNNGNEDGCEIFCNPPGMDGCAGKFKIDREHASANETARSNGSMVRMHDIINYFDGIHNGVSLRYDGYWTMSQKIYSKYNGTAKFYHELRIKPPEGYTCATASKLTFTISNEEGNSGSVQSIAPAIEADGTCVYNVGRQTGIVIPEFTKSFVNSCTIGVNGASEAYINTSTGSSAKNLSAEVIATSNDDRSGILGRKASLLLTQENGAKISASIFKNVATSFSELANNLKYYYLWYTSCRSIDSAPCQILANLTVPTTQPSTVFNTGTYLPSGSTYAFCSMSEAPAPCSGNPNCTINGGAIDCGSYQSCSAGTITNYLEEVAIKNNLPYFRRSAINPTTGITPYMGEWTPGPFGRVAASFTSGPVQAIAFYDNYDANGKITSTVFMYFIDNFLYYKKLPVVNGFLDWSDLTGTQIASSYVLPNTAYPASVTAYTTFVDPSTNKLVESIWLTDRNPYYTQAGADPTATVQGYYRSIPLVLATGLPDFAQAGAWTGPSLPSTNFLPTHPDYITVENSSTVKIPKSSGYRLLQNIWRRTASSTADLQLYKRETSWNPPAAFSLPQAWTSATMNIFGTTNEFFQAYDSHIVQSNLSDLAKINVQCLPTCDLCSVQGTSDQCLGVCGAPATLASAPNLSSLQSKYSFSSADISKVEFDIPVITDASGYEMLVMPVTSTEPAWLADALPQGALKADGSVDPTKALYVEYSQPASLSLPVEIDLTNAALVGKSPFLRVAVRACGICGCTDWTIKNIELRASIVVNYYLSQPGDSCGQPLIQPPVLAPVTSITTTVTYTKPSGFGYPATLPDLTTNTKTFTGSATQVIPDLWYAPESWFNPNVYTTRPTTQSLSANQLTEDCIADIDPIPGPNQPPPPNHPRTILAFDAWWRSVGGLIAAKNGDVISKIPPACISDSTCIDALAGALPAEPNSVRDSKNAGIPLAGGLTTKNISIVNSGGFISQNSEILARSSGGNEVTLTDQSNYDFFLDKLAKAGGPSPSNIETALETNGPWATSSKKTINGVDYYIWNHAGSDLSLNIDTPGWSSITDRKVIILSSGNITFTDTSSLPTNITVNSADGGFLLVVAEGDITFSNSVGRIVNDPNVFMNDITPVVTGMFISDQSLIIDGDGNDNITDRQFVGKGVFAGLTGLQMNRKFESATGGREYNNLIPAEIFVHDPEMVLNTPQFFKTPIIQYSEIQ